MSAKVVGLTFCQYFVAYSSLCIKKSDGLFHRL